MRQINFEVDQGSHREMVLASVRSSQLVAEQSNCFTVDDDGDDDNQVTLRFAAFFRVLVLVFEVSFYVSFLKNAFITVHI